MNTNQKDPRSRLARVSASRMEHLITSIRGLANLARGEYGPGTPFHATVIRQMLADLRAEIDAVEQVLNPNRPSSKSRVVWVPPEIEDDATEPEPEPRRNRAGNRYGEG